MALEANIQAIGRKADTLVKRLQNKHLHIAVTGLSGSGKTAFITSLIQQLISVEHADQLPLFKTLQEGRYLGAKRLPHKTLTVPAFPYDAALNKLTGTEPVWPESTRGISQISLSVKYKSESTLMSVLPGSSNRELTIDITDYPGEWLVDLPLLDMDYQAWSKMTMELIEQEPRCTLAIDWLADQKSVSADSVLDESAIEGHAKHYHEFLLTCKEHETHLSLLQPGRVILPGDLAGAPILFFAPWHETLTKEHPGRQEKNSIYRVYEARFEACKNDVVKRFYKDYFQHFDKQVLLVDMLSALNHGPTCYKDMQKAFELILNHFNYGEQNWFKYLVSPKIQQLIIAGSKSDHVTPEQHVNLQSLLRDMLSKIRKKVRYDGAVIDVLAMASIRATEVARVEHNGGRTNRPGCSGK